MLLSVIGRLAGGGGGGRLVVPAARLCLAAGGRPGDEVTAGRPVSHRFFWKDGREYLQTADKLYDVQELLNPKLTPEILEKWRAQGKVDSANNVRIGKLTPEERGLYLYHIYQDADKTPIWQLHPNDWFFNGVVLILAILVGVNIVYQSYNLLTPPDKNIFSYKYWSKHHNEHEHH